MKILDALNTIRTERDKATRPLSWRGEGRAVLFIESTDNYEVFGNGNFPTHRWDLMGDWEIVTFEEIINEQRTS